MTIIVINKTTRLSTPTDLTEEQLKTIETMKDNIRFAKKTGFDRMIRFIFQPFPNTELYDICVKNNYFTEDYDPKSVYITGNKCYVKTKEFSPEDVLKIVNRPI